MSNFNERHGVGIEKVSCEMKMAGLKNGPFHHVTRRTPKSNAANLENSANFNQFKMEE